MIDRIAPLSRAALTLTAAMVASLGLALGAVHGAPLPPEDCEKLSAERNALTAAGIPDQMAKGPEWGKVNLPLAKLAEIHRYITVDEQLAFRCNMGRIKLEIPDEEAAAEVEAKKPAKAPVKAPAAKAGAATGTAPAAAKKPAGTPKAAGVAPKTPTAKATAPSVKRPPGPSPKAPVLPPAARTTEVPKSAPAVAAPRPKPKPKPKPAEAGENPS